MTDAMMTPNNVPKIYTWRFRVRTYELDATGHVRLPAYLNYFEEGAVQASASYGYDFAWYSANHSVWVARTTTVRYNMPAGYGDELELRTWISDVRRVQSHREYDLRHLDGRPVARGRTNWVYLDSITMRPQRMPSDFAEAVVPGGLEDLDTVVYDPIRVEDPIVHTEERRVQRHELDSAGHVNNAFYLAWTEQAITNSLRAAGWPPERFSTANFAIYPLSHQIEYFRSALDDEPVWLVTRLAEVGRDRAAWHNEIRQGATNELIARAVVMRRFENANGPRSIPDALELALMQRVRS